MLFGYKPERTILQIHIAGFFNRKYRGAGHARRKPTTKRYGGTSFVVVGRYHDPKILEAMLRPKKKPDGASPGYMGYLWKGRNRGGKSPHELIPLDFTPMQISYPQDWKNAFATKGFMIAMHVPFAFASRKNRLTRALYRVGKTANVKENWDFLGELQQYGYEEIIASEYGEAIPRHATA